MKDILKRMCYIETEYGWYKCIANCIIVYQNGTFKYLFKSMSENETCCWKTIEEEFSSVKELQRLEGKLIREGTSFASPWSDQLVPELPIQDLIEL